MQKILFRKKNKELYFQVDYLCTVVQWWRPLAWWSLKTNESTRSVFPEEFCKEKWLKAELHKFTPSLLQLVKIQAIQGKPIYGGKPATIDNNFMVELKLSSKSPQMFPEISYPKLKAV